MTPWSGYDRSRDAPCNQRTAPPSPQEVRSVLIPSFRKTARLFYGAELFPAGVEAFFVRLALKRFTCRSFNGRRAELANIPDSAALG